MFLNRFIGSSLIGLIAIVKFYCVIKHCDCDKAIENMYYMKIVLYYILFHSFFLIEYYKI